MGKGSRTGGKKLVAVVNHLVPAHDQIEIVSITEFVDFSCGNEGATAWVLLVGLYAVTAGGVSPHQPDQKRVVGCWVALLVLE